MSKQLNTVTVNAATPSTPVSIPGTPLSVGPDSFTGRALVYYESTSTAAGSVQLFRAGPGYPIPNGAVFVDSIVLANVTWHLYSV
ncbi:MAG: hypothetical protein JWP74_1777 [Marmoricola sp.]|nr:hypothetical protein [Marmoricola sp.]